MATAADIIGEEIPERYISRLVRGISSESPVIDWQDIRQSAWEGFCKAALRHDPESATTLRTFAWLRTRGQALDAVRKVNGTRRRVRPQLQSLDREEIRRQASLVPSGALPTEEQALDANSTEAIMAEIEQMPEPHRAIMLARLASGQTDRALARSLGQSESTVSRLRAEGQEWLRHRLIYKRILN